MFAKQEYVTRREKLKELLGDGLVLFLGNDESGINFKHNTYPYRQDSSFIYFFGLQIPGLNAIMDLDENKEIVFGDNLSIDDIVFTGPIESLEEQAQKVGVHVVNPANSLEGYVGDAIAKGRQIHYLPPYRPEHVLKLSELFKLSATEVSKKISTNLIKAVVKLRSIKSTAEIEEIEKAVNTTVEMQYKAMEIAEAGMTEADLFGAVQNIAMANGNNTSFPSIVTIDGQILHNHYRGNLLKEGDMVLCDCGAENFSGYAGDLTRTFPVNMTFSVKQKEIYDIVYSSYKTAVGMLKPNQLFRNVHLAACKDIVVGLMELGLMKGDADKAVEAGAHTLFFQCGLGHMMGLDVHDMENLGEQYVGYTNEIQQSKDFGFKSLRLGRALEEGMVLTVEPGIYFIPELIELRKSENKYFEFVNYDKLEEYKSFGGIRVEDDFLITKNGSRLLGAKLPTTSMEIEDFRISKTRL
ncbi:aminopeptidase P family protein [Arenibacter sp. ARW7G5Y1]|uniref:aminopeptidase P family protein n=1 Tax=Arenibacter sp. ARW7G5Y1 TaxID=2135619 RepID=UPI000D75C7D4|nr:aminopeptidase P family protein [Arenibacter sp. ARW7G5Y1]PXX25376.1 Xaa-Pro aminopeptidase [Arenibacter sp. ARW7G5Y1]